MGKIRGKMEERRSRLYKENGSGEGKNKDGEREDKAKIKGLIGNMSGTRRETKKKRKV